MDINLLEDTWEREVPHDQFAWLRREAPVYWHPIPEDTGFWAITRYEDIKAISRDSRTWSTEVGSAFIRDQPEEALELMRLTLLMMDPPKQSRYRRLVSAGFTPRMITKLHDAIRERAVRIVDGIVAKGGRVEFVEDVAAELPLQVICEMLGVPKEDRHLIFHWSNRMVGFQDPDFRVTPEDGELAAAEIYAYCQTLVEDRQKTPRDDILSVLVHAEVDGDTLTSDEINLFFVLLCVAGNETTRNLIAHSLYALIQHPEAYAELSAAPDDAELWNTATEEFLRWGGSIHNFRRTATADTVVSGQEIKKGEKAVIFYSSANRDETVFAQPHTFDIHRTPNDHVAFGAGGAHFCLGANLARLQIREMIREVLRRYPHGAELAGPARRMRSDFVNGIKHMPVSFL